MSCVGELVLGCIRMELRSNMYENGAGSTQNQTTDTKAKETDRIEPNSVKNGANSVKNGANSVKNETRVSKAKQPMGLLLDYNY